MDIYQILRVRKDAKKDELQAKYLKLLESYQMIVTFAENEEVLEIAKEKLEQLLSAGKEYGLHNECSEKQKVFSSQIDIGTIKLALNSNGSDITKLKSSNISGKIDSLPESAEKHYLKAVVSLKIDSTLKGCQSAISELHKAVKFDPTNEAYIGLMDAIGEQIEDYEQRQREKASQDELERREREIRSKEALFNARLREFWNVAGPCVGGIGGIAATGLTCWGLCWATRECCSGGGCDC